MIKQIHIQKIKKTLKNQGLQRLECGVIIVLVNEITTVLRSIIGEIEVILNIFDTKMLFHLLQIIKERR